MSNDSSTGGILAPAASPAPLEDAALDAFLQGLVVGLTGLAGAVVFPRWQPEPPNLPAFATNWAAIGVIEARPDTYAYMLHDPTGGTGDGSDDMQRHEELEILCSFYGPNAGGNAAQFRDGFMVEQNNDSLTAAGFGFKETRAPVRAPELTKNRWLNRIDVPLVLKRIVLRSYPVLNVESGVVSITAQNSAGSNIVVTETVTE